MGGKAESSEVADSGEKILTEEHSSKGYSKQELQMLQVHRKRIKPTFGIINVTNTLSQNNSSEFKHTLNHRFH